jgi:hypothetical protein
MLRASYVWLLLEHATPPSLGWPLEPWIIAKRRNSLHTSLFARAQMPSQSQTLSGTHCKSWADGVRRCSSPDASCHRDRHPSSCTNSLTCTQLTHTTTTCTSTLHDAYRACYHCSRDPIVSITCRSVNNALFTTIAKISSSDHQATLSFHCQAPVYSIRVRLRAM